MYLHIKLGLIVNEQIEKILLEYQNHYQTEVKRIVQVFMQNNRAFEYRYKDISNDISYNSKCLALADAKTMFSKKQRKFHYSSAWTNSSYHIEECMYLELGLSQHRSVIKIPIYIDDHKAALLAISKNLNMFLKKVRNQWFAYITIEILPEYNRGTVKMGIDIGIKVPAVVALSNGKVRFFGNGREMRYKQRKLKHQIQWLQKQKQYVKLKKFKHKLKNVLSDYDHKISKEIIDFAVTEDVSIIYLEKLSGINRSFDIDIYDNIYLWSYRRLQENIVYKAQLHGIKVIYINPFNTSKKCPCCKKIQRPKDRDFKCICGYHAHRDVVGALNILHALDT